MFGGMRSFTVMIFAAGTLALQLAAQGTVPGWYTEELEVVATAGHPTASRFLVRTWRTADATRSERVDERLPMMKALEYSIIHTASRTQFRVNTAQRTILEFTSGDSATPYPAPALPRRVLSQSVEAMGSGDSIVGYRTRRVRERIVARVPYGVNGKFSNAVDTSVSVRWIATYADNPKLAVGVKHADKPAIAGAPPRGFVLRSETTRTVPRRMVTHLEVQRLEHRPINTVLFVLPDDYRRTSGVPGTRP